MDLQSSNPTLGLASSLATSSNYSEDLLLRFSPPESLETIHDHATDAEYAVFAF